LLTQQFLFVEPQEKLLEFVNKIKNNDEKWKLWNSNPSLTFQVVDFLYKEIRKTSSFISTFSKEIFTFLRVYHEIHNSVRNWL
jgi:hypothetical protein